MYKYPKTLQWQTCARIGEGVAYVEDGWFDLPVLPVLIRYQVLNPADRAAHTDSTSESSLAKLHAHKCMH